MVIVDTCVLIDVLGGADPFASRSSAMLAALADRHELAINPLIYAELAVGAPDLESLDRNVPGASFRRLELPYDAAFLAARAYHRYRRAGGTRQTVLVDFFVGAHAAVLGCAVLTRDVRRFRRYFPSVELFVPN